jgi:large repetitive protein
MLKLCVLSAALFASGVAFAGPVQRQSTEAGTIFLGAIAGQDWGRPLIAGDLDGDGLDDIVVSASESWGGYISRVYVLRGGPKAHRRGTCDLSVGGVDQVILGAAVDDNLGSSIAVGDVNGDGIADLLLVASNASYGGLTSRGIAYLIYGGADFFDLSERDLSSSANWDVRFLGPVAWGDMGGYNAFGGLDAQGAAIGRLNNDAYGDVILGVHLSAGGATDSGRVYVIFGGALASGTTRDLSVTAQYNVRIDGKGEYDELGTAITTGDLTGDGMDELILGNQYYSKGLFTSEGAVHIYRGRKYWSNLLRLSTTPADITLLGAREDDELGTAVVVGDFNHDGLMDLAAAAPGADIGAFDDQIGDGIVYGLLGATAYQIHTYSFDYATATPDFRLVGEFQETLGDQLSVGDFNGDGFADIAASERFAGPDTNGVVEVWYGRVCSHGQTFTANVDTDLHIVGAPWDRIGFSLAASDVNGDGLDEILFGTPFNNNDAGTIYVLTNVTGDVDHDRDVDLADAARFQVCFIGPAPRIVPADFTLFDFDLDDTVGAADFARFEAVWTGPQ